MKRTVTRSVGIRVEVRLSNDKLMFGKGRGGLRLHCMALCLYPEILGCPSQAIEIVSM